MAQPAPPPVRYADALDTLAADRAAVLGALDALSPAQRAFRPAPGVWSAEDVAEHLVRVEGGALLLLDKGLAAGDARRDLGPPATDDALDRLDAAMRSDRRVAMPEASARFIAPTGAMPYADARAALAGFADRWRDADVSGAEDAGLMTHPMAGALTPAGMARFVACHLDHHRRQIERLRAAEAFPA